MNDLLDRHSALFQPGRGTLKYYEIIIYVDPQAKPKFCKARRVSNSMKFKVEEELERLQKEGIIESVQYAEWAAPIVPILKSDAKSIRICGDFKVTVNKASKLDCYPIPDRRPFRPTDVYCTTFWNFISARHVPRSNRVPPQKNPRSYCLYLDDILITGSSIEEHLGTLEKVFQNWKM